MAVREHPSVTVEVTERVAGVVELARELMGSGLSIGADGRVSVTVGNLDDTCEGPPVDLVILDNAALASIGGARGLSARTRASLVERVAPGGLFVIGPLAPAGGAWTLMPGWTLTQHRRELPVPLDELVDGGSKDEVVLVMGRTPSAAAEISDGFVTEQVEALRPYPFAEADVESPTVTPFEPPTAEATPSETDIDASPPPDPRDDPVP